MPRMACDQTSEPVHDEAAYAEIEKVLLYVSDARERSQRAADELERAQADSYLVDALRATADRLADEHRRLMQGTYFAVPDAQLAL